MVVEEERGFWEEPFFAPIVRGATAGLAASGIQLILALAQSRRDHEQLTNYLTARHVDGVLLCSLRSDDPLPRQLEACGMPVAMVGAPTGYTPSYGVDLDNSNGARSAALHLLARGRRRLATITGPLDIQAGVDRYTGFRRALTEAGATPGGTKHGDFTRGSGIAAMQALLADDPELDAVFAANDSMAIGALQVLRESGRRVPDDVAVIGFDDSPLAIEADPPLTSVHQPLEEMGHAIARLMVALLNQETVLEPKVIFQPRLVIRQSC
ncbi:LacI family DNA-binding transcriptional regulator [Streptomyces sp. NPDC002602]|uniref:LacI family DNA-binding transcriptional regulator n=1 Tax=Streptomyces sp. NPDC002602 TaxID=3364654 RepID=UPI00367C19E1